MSTADPLPLLFPQHATLPTVAELELRYPPRALPPGAMVTRVAPSPTGMMHIGGLYTAMVNRRLAHQSGGVFILRVEDTDQKRTVAGAFETIVDALEEYGLQADEGARREPGGAIAEHGAYGPYVQTARVPLYHAVALDLWQRGRIYPCFLTEAELEAIRAEQTAAGVGTGMYGEWARSRDLTPEQILAKLSAGQPYVWRLRATGQPGEMVEWNDGVRDQRTLPANERDAVLIKSDGIPTYHFAHLVDDHFMRTTHVIRAEEWLSSMPLHLQLFAAMEWEPPRYAHVGAIQKLEGGGKRKLSKRKDPEADVRFYREAGYPREAVLEYLLNLANSDFEEWRRAHPQQPQQEFTVRLEKMIPAGPLADMVKLESIAREVLAAMPLEELYSRTVEWMRTHAPELAAALEREPEFARGALEAVRGGADAAKRIGSLADLRTHLPPFFDAFLPAPGELPFPANVPVEDRQRILEEVPARFVEGMPATEVFPMVRALAVELGYAASPKEYKAAPGNFRGHAGDVAMVLRVALCGSPRSPDLGQFMTVLGRERVAQRCRRALG